MTGAAGISFCLSLVRWVYSSIDAAAKFPIAKSLELFHVNGPMNILRDVVGLVIRMW